MYMGVKYSHILQNASLVQMMSLKAAAGTNAQSRTEQTRPTQRMPARERNVQELLGVKDAWSMTR